MLDVRGQSVQRSRGVVLEGRLGQAYNEKVFRYFLAIERKRSERSGCPFLLLLVDLKQGGGNERFDPIVAAKLFRGLWLCLRETDVIGWYREEHVAGAVLTQLADGLPLEVCGLIRQRVRGVLCEDLPSHIASCIRMHAHQLRPRLKS